MQHAPKPRLLDVVRSEIRKRHYGNRTEKQYVAWIARYIQFHDGQTLPAHGAPVTRPIITQS